MDDLPNTSARTYMPRRSTHNSSAYDIYKAAAVSGSSNVAQPLVLEKRNAQGTRRLRDMKCPDGQPKPTQHNMSAEQQHNSIFCNPLMPWSWCHQAEGSSKTYPCSGHKGLLNSTDPLPACDSLLGPMNHTAAIVVGRFLWMQGPAEQLCVCPC